MANCVPHVRAGSLIYLSGQGPPRPEAGMHISKVGGNVSAAQVMDQTFENG